MRILYLNADFVLPADRGLRVRSLTQLQILQSIDAIESVRVLSLGEAPVPEERLRELERLLPKVIAEPSVVHPSRIRRNPRVLPRFIRLRTVGRLPYLIAKCDSAEMRRRVRDRLRAERYDVVYLGYLGMAAYLRDVRELAPHARVVLEQHNVEWEIFDRLAPSFRPPLRWIARLEALDMRRFEKKTLVEVDSVIAISADDARIFRDLAGRDAVVVPPFVQPRPPRVETTTQPALGFIGMLVWQPNAYGLDWFCDKVWPLVRAQVPDATLTIAGPGLQKGPDGALVVPEAWKRPGITTVGFVESLEDLYRSCVGLVAPILGGSGVRMKLLEGMSAGMPTVTTRDGAAGLDVADGREMLVADDPAEFAERVVRVLGDAALRGRLRQSGYAYIEKRHSLKVGRERVEQALGVAQ